MVNVRTKLKALINNNKKKVVYSLATSGMLIFVISITIDLVRGKAEIYFGPVQLTGIFTGLIFIIGALFLNWPNGAWRITRITSKGLILASFVLGVSLLAINMVGEVQSMRNPLVYDGIDYFGVNRVPKYTASQVYEQMDMKTNETRKDFAKQITELIYDGVIHYWSYEGVEEYNLRVPLTENFLLFLKRFQTPEHSGKYEFCDARRAIERGVSICSQYSKILVDIMTDNGIQAKSMGLDGHVVAVVQVDEAKDIWWILDADFGVVIENNLTEVEENRDLARDVYSETDFDQEALERIMSSYGSEGNFEITNRGYCYQEEKLYKLKWSIPFASLLPFSLTTGYSVLRKKLNQAKDED